MTTPIPEALTRFAPAGEARGCGLYVHVPFCTVVCPYCDFAVSRGDAEAVRRYVEALEREVATWETSPAEFDTIYLGGGTPSLLPSPALARVLAALRSRMQCAEGTFITLEANPEDVDAARAAEWRALGVAGVSLGVQSFDAARLRFLGRRHDPGMARRAVETCLAAGFEWVSLDLIYGLPSRVGEEPSGSLADVAAAVALAPHHVSAYQLTFEGDTPFARRRRRGELAELPDDGQAEVFREAHEALAASGYAAYEVSNFARSPADRSRHNPKYWRHVPYLGLGPAAHSFDGERRWWNERDWRLWRERVMSGASPVAGEERLEPAQLALEAILLALRTPAGLDLEGYRRRFGGDLAAANAARLAQWGERGWIEADDRLLRPTLAGLARAESLAASLDPGLDGPA